MKWLRVTMLILLILAGQVARADVKWRVVRTRHFIISYAPGADSTALRAGEIAEKWHGILSRRMQMNTVGITPIYLYPDRQSFADDTGFRPDSGIVGIAHTRTYKVRVDATGALTEIEHIIPHELVHVFMSRRLRGHATRLPLWMHEGLAKYWASDWSGPDAELLADVAAGGGVLPLGKISKVFPLDEHGRSVAYVESYSAVRYIAETYTPQALLDIFAELEKGDSFDSALFNSIGSHPEKFDEDWQAFLWDKYGVARWARNLSAIGSALMAVLAGFAFRARLIKKRRKAVEMAEDESSVISDR